VSAVELEGADNASRFANCLARIVRQVALPPFRGPSVVLRPTLPFTPR
jgi:hypothetical protein